MVPKFGLYAYGLVGKSPKQLNILGIDKKNKVFLVEKDGLAVLVSKIDTDRFKDEIQEVLAQLSKSQNRIPNKVKNLLLAHQEVVDALAKVATIVPFKFATILKNETAALKMLKSHQEKLKRLLSKFTGREEWGIKAYADMKKFKNYLVKNEPEFKKQHRGLSKIKSKGAAYLLGRKIEEKIEDEMTHRLTEIAEIIFRQGERLAFQAQFNKTLPKKLTNKNKEMILNSAYLIEKEKVGGFNKQIRNLVERYKPQGVELEVSGPWPAYSFVN